MRTGLALALAIACALTAAMPAGAAVERGPRGDAFYTPPEPLAGKRHGDVIWARRMPVRRGVKAASRMVRVLYRSTTVAGEPTPVSGTLMFPKGDPPRRGWPVVTWAHGTAGVADRCAPSLYPVRRDDYGREQTGPLFTGYLRAGYAVAQTDYEGLGTPGIHPYLVGRSEARSVLDMARAARKLDRRIGRRVLIAGHSQGGHAALWAAGEADDWTPDLRILGTQPFAPISRVSALVGARESLTMPGGLAPEAALFVRAFDSAFGIEPADYITERALELYPQTLERCIGELFAQDSFGGISVAEMSRDDADWDPIMELTLREIDQNEFAFPRRVLLLHGTEDATVPVALSDNLVQDLRNAGTRVTYRRVAGADHSGIVSATRRVAVADARKRLR
jgi:pimeloyl-ACP methyl ester carboxylesterase